MDYVGLGGPFRLCWRMTQTVQSDRATARDRPYYARMKRLARPCIVGAGLAPALATVAFLRRSRVFLSFASRVLYGRLPWITWRCWLIDERAACLHPRATIKAHYPSTQPPSPLRSSRSELKLMPIRPITQMNKLPRPSVGADLSRTPPIHRPSLATPSSNKIVHLQY